MRQQRGWRTCRICQGLINTNLAAGTCLDNAMHDFNFSEAYRAVLEFPDNVQRGWGTCVRCCRMVCRFVAPGVCWDGGAHEFDQFDVELGAPFGPDHEGTRPGWRWCSKCQCLNDADNPSHRCYAGGDHDFSASGDYAVPIVPFGLQGWWGWCTKCQGMGQGQNYGVCHDGDLHRFGSETYELTFGTTPPGAQFGWRQCIKCALVTFADAAGPCYAGGTHDYLGSLVFSLLAGPTPAGAQPGWRWCSKCQIVSFSGFSNGPCPADGGEHDHAASGTYSTYPSNLAGGQPGWRRCGKCNAMTQTQVGEGACRDGGPHEVSTSNAYSIQNGFTPPGGDAGWQWCSRCQMLAYADGGPGNCSAGGGHDFTDSDWYGLPVEFPAEDSEPGWRRCARCQALAFNGSGVPDGLCADGLTHDFTGSPEFHIAVHALASVEPVVPPPQGPTLLVVEAEQVIVVDGTGFPAVTRVTLSFIEGATTIKVDVVTNDDGAFQHGVNEVVPATAGLVVARTQDGVTATGRLTEFMPAPPQPQP